MKKIIRLFYFIMLPVLFSFIITSCNNDDVETKPMGIIKLGVTVPISKETTTAVPSKIKATIKDDQDVVVFDDYITIADDGSGNFISEEIEVIAGSYNITEYLVADEAGNVIYATPTEGSATAGLVSDPLPFRATVNAGVPSVIAPEVISTEEYTPEDFGYLSFSFEVVTALNVMVSVKECDNSGCYPVASKIIIRKNNNVGDIVVEKEIPAGLNQIFLEASNKVEYHFTVINGTDSIQEILTYTNLYEASKMESNLNPKPLEFKF